MSAKKILVVVDPTTDEEQPVIRRAAWLAQKTGAALELFACDYDADIDAGRVATVWIPEPGTREHLLVRHRQKLDDLAAPLRERGLSVTVDVTWDYPLADAIIKRAAAEHPWLVAKDTHHHTLVQRTLLTHTDWQLIRECPVPLLLVKQRDIASKPIVLAAVDPLHVHDKPAVLDDAIYKFAASLAESSGGALHVVHASASPLGVELPAETRELMAAEHRKAMATFVETHPVAGDNVHVLDGLPHQRLQYAVEHQEVDFLVMGAVARRGIKKLLIGSTAARVLDRLTCDLVIIKPAELFLPRRAKGIAMRAKTVILGVGAALLAGFGVSAFEAVTLADYSGEEIFMKYCAACHGESGRGDGPVAPGLATMVPDLTAISRRFGGFPTTSVRDTIDGRGARIDAHGTRTMPVWGYEFWIEEGGDVVAQGEMKAVITKLVEYIQSIQGDSLAPNRN